MFYREQRKKIFTRILSKGESSLHDLWIKSRIEITETREAKRIFVRYVERKGITSEERGLLKSQTLDIIKIIIIGLPLAVIPGFSIVVIFLVKIGRRYKFNVLPSSFAYHEKEEINDVPK